MNSASAIEQVANTILYEGFLLYPYRLSSVKNRHRWNFGVLYPEPFAAAHSERPLARTECLLAVEGRATVDVKVRFLQLADGTAVERAVLIEGLSLEDLTLCPHESPIALPPLAGVVEIRAEKLQASLFKLSVSVTNTGQFSGDDRDEALTRALISTHSILTVQGGKFISQIDPPEALKPFAAGCRNLGAWPVLVGRDDAQMLSAPIILYDHPQIAPQSHGDLFDGTEIDEILTLRVRTLTEDEKSQARAADPRVRALLDRSEALTREELLQLHAPMHRTSAAPFRRGDRVRLQPKRRADIFDIALAGRLATIVAIEQDFEDQVHLCVTVDDDPGKDLGLRGQPGHRFFFSTDEVEPA